MFWSRSACLPFRLPPTIPVTAEAVALGRKLFYDPRLSADNTLSCASCHNPLLDSPTA